MDKSETLKLEIFSWKKISHGLFDYENKNCQLTNVKTNKDSLVFVRAGNTVRTFPTFIIANKFKENEIRGFGKEEAKMVTILFCIIKDKDELKLYSYNQLEVILNYFDNHKKLEQIDMNLYQVFKG